MTWRVNGVVVPLALITFACAPQQPSVRVSTPSETSAILAPLMADWPREYFCINPALRPPLEDARESAEWKKAQQQRLGIWGRLIRWLETSLDTQGAAPIQNWSLPEPNDKDEDIPLRHEDSEMLNDILARGTISDLKQSQMILPLPSSVATCSEKQLNGDDQNPRMLGRVTVSQPVIIDNIAFVEIGTVCGGLCGSGHLTALINRNGKWTALAEIKTWVS